MVVEVRSGHDSPWAAIESMAHHLGIGSAETVRTWVRRAEVDAGSRPGVTTEAGAELARFKRENAELRRAKEILEVPAAFFGAELETESPDSPGGLGVPPAGHWMVNAPAYACGRSQPDKPSLNYDDAQVVKP